MITANEMRIRQNNNEEEQQMKVYQQKTQESAITFANTILNEELIEKSRYRGQRIVWDFIVEAHSDTYLPNKLPKEERALPVREAITTTKAKRLNQVNPYELRYGININTLKEFLEQHGYNVVVKKWEFEEESWSRKTTWTYDGFKMVISWEE